MLTALSLAGLFAIASAEPSDAVHLSWKVAAECPDEDAFWRALASRSTRVRPASTSEGGHRVSVEIQRAETGTVARVAIDDAEPRSITAGTCGEAVAAMAIVTAMVLGPTAGTAEAPPSAPVPIDAPTTPASSVRAPDSVIPSPESATGPRSPGRWRWRIGAGVDAFATARVGTVFTTPVSLEVERDVALRLNLSRGRSDIIRNERGPGARFVWTTARLDVCLPRGRPTLALQPCAGMEAGSLAGDPTDTDRPRSNHRLWLAAHLLARASLALGPVFSLELEGGTALTLTRPDFYVDPDYFVYRPAAFVFHARSGLAVRFP